MKIDCEVNYALCIYHPLIRDEDSSVTTTLNTCDVDVVCVQLHLQNKSLM